MRDNEQTNEQTVKIELLSQWKLEAEFRNTKCNCKYRVEIQIQRVNTNTEQSFVKRFLMRTVLCSAKEEEERRV